MRRARHCYEGSMNEHFHEYLKKRIARPVMSEACKHM